MEYTAPGKLAASGESSTQTPEETWLLETASPAIIEYGEKRHNCMYVMKSDLKSKTRQDSNDLNLSFYPDFRLRFYEGSTSTKHIRGYQRMLAELVIHACDRGILAWLVIHACDRGCWQG